MTREHDEFLKLAAALIEPQARILDFKARWFTTIIAISGALATAGAIALIWISGRA